MSEIVNLIRMEEKEHVKEILKEIKTVNKEAYKFMTSPTRPYRPLKQRRYRLFVRTDTWTKGKRLLWEYYTRANEGLECKYCNRKLTSRRVLHHETYNWTNLFTPNYAFFCCPACHEEIYGRDQGD